jgi:hypothetical protein
MVEVVPDVKMCILNFKRIRPAVLELEHAGTRADGLRSFHTHTDTLYKERITRIIAININRKCQYIM